jgi:hypothetical protein
MPRNRFRPIDELLFGEPDATELPRFGCAFVALPAALFQGLPAAQLGCQASLYQLAFEQARAQLQPSLPERDLLGVWN